ncbi:MAG: hypothetical protein A4E72_00173 [Syntrophus sp. PtaU1.Bin208]|nr:MAG: hypothetical protein A4E72_00173 [Syntrophus sp. PtaU1.Bin208]
MEAAIPSVQGDIGLSLLNPEIGPQDLQRLPVLPDGLNYGRNLENRHDARIKAARCIEDEIRLLYRSADGLTDVGTLTELNENTVDRQGTAGEGRFSLSTNRDTVAILQYQLPGDWSCRMQTARGHSDGQGKRLNSLLYGFHSRRAISIRSICLEYGRREQQISQALPAGRDNGPIAARGNISAERRKQVCQIFGTIFTQLPGDNEERVDDIAEIPEALLKPVVENAVNNADDLPG